MHDPERYETFKSAAIKDGAAFIPQLIAGMTWKANERILDYGCGAGSTCLTYFTQRAQMHNSLIDAVDISQEMIDYANEKNSHPLVKYYQGNILASDFPLKAKSYDRIFCIYVIHFMKDYKSTFQEFYKLLKPGGELGITVVTKAPIFSVLETMGKSERWGPYMKGYENFLPSWYERGENAEDVFKNALDEIGFIITYINTEQRDHKMEAKTLIELTMSLNPFLKNIPENLHPELMEEYRTVIAQHVKLPRDFTTVDTHYFMVISIAVKPTVVKKTTG